MKRGSIVVEEAYAQGKMLDSSSWDGLLPRNITPSDVDLVFDDLKYGRRLFCEFARNYMDWRDVPRGQSQLYRSLVVSGCGSTYAALVSHDVPIDQTIDTLHDVMTFQVMRYREPNSATLSQVTVGWQAWQVTVESFYRGETL